jgi:hypothetical protein
MIQMFFDFLIWIDVLITEGLNLYKHGCNPRLRRPPYFATLKGLNNKLKLGLFLFSKGGKEGFNCIISGIFKSCFAFIGF